MDRQKKILITGGAGFIGSHLCERLLKDGNEVVCLDNFHTGSKQNIVHLLSNPFFEVMKHDVTVPFFVEVDEIYNLACPASPVQYQKHPTSTIKTSVLGSINVLNLAKDLGCKVFQASTSEVYGDPEQHPQTEKYWGNVNPVGIRSCYDEGKRCAETIFMDYHRQFNVRIKIARIFNTYGSRMLPNDGRVIPNFIVQALQNKDITIYGDGTQTRSFQYIDDLIEGIIKLMETNDAITGPVNVGNPKCFTMLELAEHIVNITNSTSKITYKSLPQDDPKQRQPNIELAELLLGWSPKIHLEEGLEKTIEYFKKQIFLKPLKIKECND